MFSKIVIFLALLTLVAAGKGKGKGKEKGEGTSKKCKKMISKFQKNCVKKGYTSQIQENCVINKKKKMNGKKAKNCEANEKDAVDCGYQCTVDGGWGEFGEWSECSAECGGGTQSRSRSCDNPLPVSGGAQCEGDPSESRDCNVFPCPVDGGWTKFTDWSECSKECGGGMQYRSRTCTNPVPAHGGKRCEGEADQISACNIRPCEGNSHSTSPPYSSPRSGHPSEPSWMTPSMPEY